MNENSWLFEETFLNISMQSNLGLQASQWYGNLAITVTLVQS